MPVNLSGQLVVNFLSLLNDLVAEGPIGFIALFDRSLTRDHRDKACALCAAECSRTAAAGSGSIGSNNVEIVSNDHVDKFHVFKITFRCYDYADSDYSAVLSAIYSESNLRLLHSDTAALDNLFNLI